MSIISLNMGKRCPSCSGFSFRGSSFEVCLMKNHIKYMMEDYAVFVYLIAEPPLENKSKESGAGDTEMTIAD